jgi:hypothetical protein
MRLKGPSSSRSGARGRLPRLRCVFFWKRGEGETGAIKRTFFILKRGEGETDLARCCGLGGEVAV